MKYNSQPPIMPPVNVMGGQPHVNSFFGIGTGNALAQGARAAQQKPNPLTSLKPGKPGLATAEEIQSMQQKAAKEAPPNWLQVLFPDTLQQEKKAGSVYLIPNNDGELVTQRHLIGNFDFSKLLNAQQKQGAQLIANNSEVVSDLLKSAGVLTSPQQQTNKLNEHNTVKTASKSITHLLTGNYLLDPPVIKLASVTSLNKSNLTAVNTSATETDTPSWVNNLLKVANTGIIHTTRGNKEDNSSGSNLKVASDGITRGLGVDGNYGSWNNTHSQSAVITRGNNVDLPVPDYLKVADSTSASSPVSGYTKVAGARLIRGKALHDELINGMVAFLTKRSAAHPLARFDPKLIKSGMTVGNLPPQVGVTANQPTPPGPAGTPPMSAPGMPVTPPANGGAPINQAPGQPTLDPNTGQPMQAQPGQPQQGQQPQQNTAMDPATGQPITSPMQDAPAPPLPINPQMSAPRAPTPRDHYQSSVINGLGSDMQAAENPANADEATEDIQAEAMAMGSKTAGDFMSQLLFELGYKAAKSIKAANYTFDAEDCPKCKVSMEGDSYTGKCNSCGHRWGTKKASLGPAVGPKPPMQMKPPIKPMGNPSPGGSGAMRAGTPAAPHAGAPAPPTPNLKSPIEKVAGPIPFGLLSRGAGAVGKGLGFLGNGAATVGKAVAPVAKPIAKSVAPSVGGALGGGFAGNDLGLGGQTVGQGEGGLNLNVRGMALGAMAANPMARRLVARNVGGAGLTPMRAVTQAGIGSMAGSGIDQSAAMMGVDTQGRFGQVGAWGGLGLGGAVRSARALSPAVGGAVSQANKQLGQFSTGVFEPYAGAMKTMVRKPIQWASNGAYSGGKLLAPTPAAEMTVGRTAGRLVGGAGMVGGGIGYGIHSAQNAWENNIKPGIQNEAVEAYNKAVPAVKADIAGYYDDIVKPQLQQDATGLANNYLRTLGLLGADNKIDASGLMRRTAVGLLRGSDPTQASQPGIQNEAVEAYNKALPAVKADIAGYYDDVIKPQLQQDVTSATNNYLKTHGLLNEDNKIDASGIVRRAVASLMRKPVSPEQAQAAQRLPGMFSRAMGHTDGLFSTLGINPGNLSAAQKAMILGGAGIGAYGLATKKPWVAGAGGVASLAALAPYLADSFSATQSPTNNGLMELLQQQQEQRQQQQSVNVLGMNQAAPNTPMARNEWQLQQGQQLRDVNASNV